VAAKERPATALMTGVYVIRRFLTAIHRKPCNQFKKKMYYKAN